MARSLFHGLHVSPALVEGVAEVEAAATSGVGLVPSRLPLWSAGDRVRLQALLLHHWKEAVLSVSEQVNLQA